jgi:hypothetical protein
LKVLGMGCILGLSDTETQRHRDTETQSHRNTEPQRHRDTGTSPKASQKPQNQRKQVQDYKKHFYSDF